MLSLVSNRLTILSARADAGEDRTQNGVEVSPVASQAGLEPTTTRQPASQHAELQNAAEAAPDVQETADAPAQPPADERSRQLLIGRWKGFLHGARSLEVRADGTATMVSEPEGMAARLIAPRLEFEIIWKIDGGKLSFHTTGGKPVAKANLVLKLYGSHRTHPIVSLDEQQAILANDDGSTELWERVPAE